MQMRSSWTIVQTPDSQEWVKIFPMYSFKGVEGYFMQKNSIWAKEKVHDFRKLDPDQPDSNR
jgi:hypothetical protein